MNSLKIFHVASTRNFLTESIATKQVFYNIVAYMQNILKIMHIILWLLIFTSCAIQNNFPENCNPNQKESDYVTTAFVDQLGNFYPENWQNYYLNNDSNYGNPAFIHNQKAILDEIKHFSNRKERIFILIHGYNNNGSDAKKAFRRIESIIDYDKTKDGFIEFHWDGLVAKGIGASKIWFNAVGNSQMAGQYGVRKILNHLSNKEIIMISHSRGASVVLSALSNPPYEKDFVNATSRYFGINIYDAQPLLENHNNITCIFLAPAIGQIDFRKPENLNTYRDFPPQVKVIHHTVNNTDPILKKYVGIPTKFNATNLGSNYSAFEELSTRYRFLKMTDVTGIQSHAFMEYLNDYSFREILHQNHIRTKNNNFN